MLEIVEHDALDSVTGSPAGEPDKSAINAEIEGWKADMMAAESLEELRTITGSAIEWAKDNANKQAVSDLKAFALKASQSFNQPKEQ